MMIPDITLAAFTLCNSARIVAYVPQITKAATDTDGAQAISFTTWALFLVSNASAVAYALVNKDDLTNIRNASSGQYVQCSPMAMMFTGNAIGCAAILLIGTWKRARRRNR